MRLNRYVVSGGTRLRSLQFLPSLSSRTPLSLSHLRHKHLIHTCRTCIDITGNLCNISLETSPALIDEAMFNMISSEAEPTTQLHELLKDEDCTVARSLLLFDMLLQGNKISADPAVTDLANKSSKTTLSNNINNIQTIESLLNYLENKAKDGSLNVREMHLAAAALSWSEKDYLSSAKLLEAFDQSSSFDALVLKLAQSAYRQCGDVSNVFSCIARCSHVLNTNHHLYGHMQGMLAFGHVANQRIIQAEQTATLALSITRGKDYSAIETLFQVYQLTGRTSEIFEITETNRKKDELFQKPLFLYYDSLGKIQRGNYSGASTNFQVLVDLSDDNPLSLPVYSVIYATLILWTMQLNSTNPDILLLWQEDSYRRCWQRIINPNINVNMHKSSDASYSNNNYNNNSNSSNGDNSSSTHSVSNMDPLLQICYSMYLYHNSLSLSSTSQLHMDNIITKAANAAANVALEDSSPKKSIWQWIKKTTRESRKKKDKMVAPVIDRELSSIQLQGLYEKLVQQAGHNSSNNNSQTISNADCRATITGTGTGTGRIVDTTTYPNLRLFQNKHVKQSLDTFPKRRHSIAQSTLSVYQAVHSFMKTDYVISSQLFRNLSTECNFNNFGCSLVEKEVLLHHPMIESLMRIEDNVQSNINSNSTDTTTISMETVSDSSRNTKVMQVEDTNSDLFGMKYIVLRPHLEEAKKICCERIILNPNDAQAWRRLSALFGMSGQLDLAHHAHHTAWQLGIGQGGFGGPS